MRIRLQRHIRTKAHKKRSATVSPYVGIIQIRFWVKASAYSQPACASTPFFNDFHYTHSPQKSKLCFP